MQLPAIVECNHWTLAHERYNADWLLELGAGLVVDKGLFGLRCDNHIVVWQAVRAGLGIGVGLQRVAAQSPEVVRVLEAVPVPALPLWITAHRELRGTPRLKVVFDALTAALAKP